MKYNPQKHHRRSIRLKGYDYHNAGAYFVTICTKNRVHVLDDPIVNEIVIAVWQALPRWFPTIELDEFIIMRNHTHFVVWIVGTPLAGVPVTDAHILNGNQTGGDQTDNGNTDGSNTDGGNTDGSNTDGSNTDGSNTDGGKPHPYTIPEPKTVNYNPTLGDIVGAFKSLVFTVYLDWIERNDPTRRAKFWQGNYYEHIIRNNRELNAIRQYIVDNPINWETDRDNLQNQRQLPPPEKVDEYLQDIEELLPLFEEE